MLQLVYQHQSNFYANLQRIIIKIVITFVGLTVLSGCVTRAPEKQSITPQTTTTKYKNPPISKTSKRLSVSKHVNNEAKNCLALAMYWEARGEGTRGMLAVGSVVLNRVENQHFPNSVCTVIYEGGETPPCQFSWWCDGKSDRPQNRMQWQSALNLADKLLSNQASDPTDGALFFHNTSVRSSFHKTRQRTARIGNHIFYR